MKSLKRSERSLLQSGEKIKIYLFTVAVLKKLHYLVKDIALQNLGLA